MLQHSLRKLVMSAVCALPVVLVGANSALADQRDFTVHNETSQDVYYLYVSASSSDSWGSDVLGENTVLSPGNSVFVYFDSYSDTCLYDIRAVTQDGSELDDRQINLCQVTDYYIQ